MILNWTTRALAVPAPRSRICAAIDRRREKLARRGQERKGASPLAVLHLLLAAETNRTCRKGGEHALNMEQLERKCTTNVEQTSIPHGQRSWKDCPAHQLNIPYLTQLNAPETS